MRLCLFGPGFPFRGGIARTTTELARTLDERGHQVLFLTPRRQYPKWLYPGDSDLDPEACRVLECAEAVLDPFNPTTWRSARRRAEAHRAEAWIIPYWTWAWSGLWRSVLRGRNRPTTVSIVHNPVDHDARLWQRWAARSVLGKCQGLFTHARVLAQQLERAHPSIPVAHHSLPAVGPPVRVERGEARRSLDLPDDRRVAVFVGLIRPYKGVDGLLEAAAALPPDSDWLVVVAGEPWGDLGDRLKKQAGELGLGGRVRFDLRWIPEIGVARLLAAADVLVLPYRRGSQSAVAPMALAHGVPVVSTAVGGVPEVVCDGVNGVVIPPEDPEALAHALESLDAARLGTLSAGARRSAKELTWAGYAAELEDLLVRLG